MIYYIKGKNIRESFNNFDNAFSFFQKIKDGDLILEKAKKLKAA